MAFDSIIAPTPAGGAGTGRGGSAQAGGAAGGFFFRKIEEGAPTRADVASAAASEDAERRKKRRQTEPKRAALRDAAGREVCLTLEQAERDVEAYLASLPGAGGEGRNDDEEKEGKDAAAAAAAGISSWEDVGITDPTLLRNLKRSMLCASPLSVQDQALPPALSGSDVLISTHTGSGKTLAFLAPLAQRLLVDAAVGGEGGGGGVKVVIVAPGRELASQIVSVARELFEGTGLRAQLAIGGTPFGRSVEALRKKKPDFVVGTPGRIAELVVGRPEDKGGKMKLGSLRTIVLDEFDALLQYDPHRGPTTAVMREVRRRRGPSLQSIMCSATATDMMGKAALEELLRPGYAHARADEADQLITSGRAENGSGDGMGDGTGSESESGATTTTTTTTTRVSRTAIHGTIRIPHKKLSLETVRRVLYTDPAPQQVLIFVDSSRRVEIVVSKLAAMGIIAAPLHGGQGSDKTDRAEVSRALREGYVGIVVATELAARGIDAPYLTHVVNLDLPTDASHYAHRAGRCGRGGRPGVVVNIASGPREGRVPYRMAAALGIDMREVEPRAGRLVVLEEEG